VNCNSVKSLLLHVAFIFLFGVDYTPLVSGIEMNDNCFHYGAGEDFPMT
jgi:hypothetical protein